MIRTILFAAALLVAPAAAAQANPSLKAYDEAMIRKVAGAQEIDVKSAGVDPVTKAPFLAMSTSGNLDFRAVGAGCSGRGAKQVCRTIVLEAEYNMPPDLDFEGFAGSFNDAYKPTRIYQRGIKVVCANEFPLGGRKQNEFAAVLKEYTSTAMALGGAMKQ